MTAITRSHLVLSVQTVCKKYRNLIRRLSAPLPTIIEYFHCAFPRLLVHLPRTKRTSTRIRISYQDGRGLLRDILIACTQLRFAIDNVDVDRNKAIETDKEEAQDLADFEGSQAEAPRKGLVSMSVQVKGKRPVSHLIARLSDIDGVSHVGSVSEEAELE